MALDCRETCKRCEKTKLKRRCEAAAGYSFLGGSLGEGSTKKKKRSRRKITGLYKARNKQKNRDRVRGIKTVRRRDYKRPEKKKKGKF